MAEPATLELTVPGVGTVSAYRWEGSGAARPLVVVHGYAEHAMRHRRLAEAGAGAGHTVIAVDLPGHGRSAGPRALVRSYEPLVAAVRAAVAAAFEAGAGRPALFGHSMGGAVALAFALQEPAAIERLVLSSPYLLDAKKRPPWVATLAGVVAAVAPSMPLVKLDTGALSRDPGVAPAYAGDPLVYSGMVKAATGYTLTRSGAELLVRASRLSVPTLVVHGEADASASIEGSRRLAAAAPAGTISLITFPGGFHELHNEPEETGVPQRFVETVLAFAGGQAPGVRAPASRDSASSSTS